MPVVDGDGNTVYENVAVFEDNQHYGGGAYGSLGGSNPVHIHTYTATFSRQVSSVKFICTGAGSGFMDQNYVSINFYIMTAQGLSSSSVNLTPKDPRKILNVDIKLGQLFNVLTFDVVASGRSSSSSIQGGGYFTIENIKVFLPERIF